jgi:hypothetical protein
MPVASRLLLLFAPLSTPQAAMEVNLIRRFIEDLAERSESLRRFL